MARPQTPKTVMFAPGVTKSKVRHLEQGFRELGSAVIYDREFSRRVIEAECYPFRLVYRKKRKPVDGILDITASRRKVHDELVTDKNFYFKTHLAKSDLKRHPRIFPMPQSTANLKYFQHIDHLRSLRSRSKLPIDIVAIFVNSDAGLRQRVVEHIMKGDWKAEVGMIQHHKLQRPEVPARLIRPKLRYYDHLALQAQAKICVALTGARKNQGADVSFRHVEIWGMGGCVLTVRGGTVIVGKPKGIVAEFRKDLNDLTRKINNLLQNEKERKMIGARAMKHFVRHHTPRAHALHILQIIEQEV